MSAAPSTTCLLTYSPHPKKNEKLNNLDEPHSKKKEEMWGIKLGGMLVPTGRRSGFTSTKLQGARKQPVQIIRELPHCSGLYQPEIVDPTRIQTQRCPVTTFSRSVLHMSRRDSPIRRRTRTRKKLLKSKTTNFYLQYS